MKKKHRQDIFTVIRSLKKRRELLWKWVLIYIKYIKTCRKERLTPTFAKVNISQKDSNFRLRRKIATLIMETEMQNKYSEKLKLNNELKQIPNILKRSLNLVILIGAFRQLNIALKSNLKLIANIHQKKLANLQKE